jgi:large-conductance mechanosensitive channel
MIVKWIRSFALFWYDFVVGDDWLLAIGVVVGLGFTALLAHSTSVAAWWVTPIVVLAVLATSTLLAGRKAKT